MIKFINLKSFRVLPLSSAKARGTKAMNLFLKMLYREGFWIRREQGITLSNLHLMFLKCYQFAVSECLERGMNRFTLVPKIHMMHHCAIRMKLECAAAQYCCNPLSESVQIQEDFIGRPSRLSRRVGIRLVHLRVLQRSLIAHQFALRSSDLDDRC